MSSCVRRKPKEKENPGNNTARTKGCYSKDCMACKHGRRKGGEGRRNGVGYELACGEKDVCYVGETGQNAYNRGFKHIANYRGKHSDSLLWKHAQLKHSGKLDISYSMKVVRYFKEPLTRQVNEAVRITNCGATTQLNSKTEWHVKIYV